MIALFPLATGCPGPVARARVRPSLPPALRTDPMTRTWLVTGSSRGLGRALTTAALDAGDSVLATARDPEHLSDLADRFGDRVRVMALDVTDQAAAPAAVQAAVDAFGRLDVVVNNAGQADSAPLEETTEES